MATLPDLQKGVFKDPDPPVVDSVLSPITIANGTTLITTKTTNETIDNVDQLIDYVSGDAGPNFIPQSAIDTLVSDLAARELLANKVTIIGTPGDDTNYGTEKAIRDALNLKEDSLGFTPEDSANKGAISGYAGLNVSQELLLANFPSGTALQLLRRNSANDALEFVDPTFVEVFTWTADHSMATFKLTAAAANNVILNSPTGQGISIEVDGVQEYLLNDTELNMFDKNLTMGNGIINFTGATIAEVSNDMIFDVAAPFSMFNFSFGTIVQLRLEQTLANFGSGGSAYTLQFGDVANRRILVDIEGFIFEIESGTTTKWDYEIAGILEYRFDELAANFNSNNIVNLGTLNTHTIQGGTSTFALFSDNLSVFANTTSAQLAGVIDDETGSGLLVFGTSPTIVTPVIASFVTAQHNHEDPVGGGTLLAAAISDFDASVSANSDVTANTAKITNATHTGDVTGATVLTIADNAVTLAKIQDIATASFIGRITAATGDPEVLTGTQATTLLDVFTDVLQGLVPASGGGTTNFLRADGTFAVPAGGGSGSIRLIKLEGVTISTDREGLNFADTSTINFTVTDDVGNDEADVIASIVNDSVVDAQIGTHTSTKITITAKGQLNSAIVYNDQANVFGDFIQTFKDNSITIESPDGLTPTTLVNAQQTLARNLTIPILTADRDIVVTGEASQITLGTEVTGASTDLTDSANLARITTGNTFGAFLQSFAASSMRIPLSATPIMAVDGDFAIDTLVTDFSHGIIKYFDGEELGVVSMPIVQFVTPTDGDVVAYNATNDEFELVTISGAGITSINGETGAAQTIAGTTNRIDVDTTLDTQTIDVGIDVVLNNQANSYTGGGTQNFGTAGIENVSFFTTVGNIASVGAIRFIATDAIVSRNAAETGDIQLIQLTGTDIVAIGDTNDSGVLISTFLQIAFAGAQSGVIRLVNNTAASWRNFVNSADLGITFDVSDAFSFVGSLEVFGSNIFTNHPTLPALDSAADTLLIRDATDGSINEVTPDDLGITGEVFTWTNDHSMATFKLTAAAANDVILNAPTGQGVSIEVAATPEYLFDADEFNTLGNNITIGAGVLNFTTASISEVTNDLEFDVAVATDRLLFNFAGVNHVRFEQNLTNFAASGVEYTLRFGDIVNRSIIVNADGYTFDAQIGASFDYRIDGIAEYSFNALEFNMLGNNLLDVTDIGDNINPVTDIYLTTGLDVSHIFFDGTEAANNTYITGGNSNNEINFVTNGNSSMSVRDGVLRLQTSTSVIEFNNGTNPSINATTDGSLQFDVLGTNDFFEFRFTNIAQYIFGEDELDVLGHNIINVGTLEAQIVSVDDTILFQDGSTQEEAATRSGIDWELSTISFTGNSFAVGPQETQPAGLFFRPNGLKFYIIGAGSDRVNEYDMTTAWDVTTAVFLQFFDISGQDIQSQGVFFRSDGLKMYIVGIQNDEVHEYDLGTAWDVTTAVILQSFDVFAQDNQPREVFFRSDGLKMYVVGAQNSLINEYNLTTAWDISTAAFLQSFNVSAQEAQAQGLFFRPDGLKMYVVGIQSDSVHQYDLTTPWDVTTSVFITSFNVATENNQPQAIFFRSDGLRMYMTGSQIDSVFEYVLGIVVPGNSEFQGAVDLQSDISVDLVETDFSGTTRNDVLIGITDNTVAITITITSADTLIRGKILIIKDQAGTAGSVNNITIATEGAETIDGATFITIAVDFGVVRLYSNGTDWFIW